MKKYIPYYRVSTNKQESTRLGLDGQIESVENFIQDKGIILNQYEEVESGKNNSRPQLLKAIDQCKKENATLIIAKLDRLSRNVIFTYTLKESGVDFVCVDNPEVNWLTIGVLAVIAQEEVEKTSDRTKSALAVIKDKISKGIPHISKSGNIVTKLGSSLPVPKHVRQKGVETIKQKAFDNPDNKRAGMLIVSLKDDAGYTFYKITKKLNESDFKTPRGGKFSQSQTKRLYERYSNDI